MGLPNTCLSTKIPNLELQIFISYCLYIKSNSWKEKIKHLSNIVDNTVH